MFTFAHTIRATAAPTLQHSIARRPLRTYFLLAYALMWLPVLPMTLSRNLGVGLLPYDLPDVVGLLLYLMASFSGPTVAALIVTGATEGRAGVRRLLTRCIQWRVAPQWYVVALLANLTIWLLGYSTVVGLQLIAAALTHWPLLFSSFLPLIGFGILIPAIGEEPGWRGFALPRLQERYGPVAASLILGTLHGLWHLPALFTAAYGPLPLANLLPFILTAAVTTVIYTWVYNHTQGSILIVILFHASGNAATNWLTALVARSDIALPHDGLAGYLVETNWLSTLAYGVVALLLIVMTRGRLGIQDDRGAPPGETWSGRG